jgi:O-antigen ligase
MKKNKKNTLKSSPISESTVGSIPEIKATQGLIRWIPLLLVVLYFGVEWIGSWDGIEYLGSQWLYLMMVNFVVVGFIYSQKDNYQSAIRSVFSTALIWVYLILGLWALFSWLYALNATETLVCLVRLATAIIVLLNVSILFYQRATDLRYVAAIAAFFLLVQSAISLLYFFKGSSEITFTELVLTMRLNAGNKNIYAASMVVKIPFVLMGIYFYKNAFRIFYAFVLLLAAITIFLLNSRTALVAMGMSTVAYLLVSIIAFSKEKSIPSLAARLLIVTLTLGMAVISSRVATNYAKFSYNDGSINGGQYGTIEQRVASIGSEGDESTIARFRLWNSAWDYAQKHPFMGCGFGNWKLASIPYSREFNDGLIVPIHAHNDFLEYFAELGFPGGILYALLFLFFAVYGIRTYLHNPLSDESVFTIFSLIAVVAFAIDSSLNFPKEEPINQLMLAIAGMGVLSGYTSWKNSAATAAENKPAISGLPQLYSFVLGLLMIPILYIGFLIWRSSVSQNLYVQELNAVTLTAPVDQVVNAFPAIPNLVSNTVQPIEGMLGMYLWKNQRVEEAERYLRRGQKANPYMMYVENIRANMYYQKEKWDSAAYFAKLCLYERPRNPTYYQTFMACVARTYDTATLRKGFELYNKYHPKDAFCWNLYLSNMLNASQGADAKLKQMADSALRIFPADTEIQKRNQDISTAFTQRR